MAEIQIPPEPIKRIIKKGINDLRRSIAVTGMTAKTELPSEERMFHKNKLSLKSYLLKQEHLVAILLVMFRSNCKKN